MNPLRRCVLAGVVALGATSRVHAQATPGVSSREIVLGQSAPLSSSWGELARAYRDGALLFFNHLNSKGGVHGRTVRLVSIDDGYVVDKTIANTKRLLQEEKVFALTHYMLTNSVRAAIPLAREAGAPFIAPYAGYEELYAKQESHVFTTRASFSDELGAIVRHLLTTGVTRIASVGYNSSSGNEMMNDAQARLAANSLKLTAQVRMDINSKDARKAVAAMKAADAQAIILSVSGSDAVAFIREYETVTGKRPQYFARSVVGAAQLIKELGHASRGITVTQLVPTPFRATSPLAREYRARLAELPGSMQPDYASFEGYIAARVLAEGLQRAGAKLTREGLLEALRTMKVYDAGGMVFEFSPVNHHGSRLVELTMIGKDGRIFD
jgi:branched-chain amino acid transport system substrate-binding protein